jgi:hypothetical protein
VIPYSAYPATHGTANDSGAYACFLCLSNSTCSYCNNGGCMNSAGQCEGGKIQNI